MTLRALIFDFDGLIVDTESSSLEMASEVFRRFGHELPSELWQRCVGSRVDVYAHLQELVGHDGDVAPVQEELSARRAADARLGPRPGVVELVTAAAAMGLRLAVASSSSRPGSRVIWSASER